MWMQKTKSAWNIPAKSTTITTDVDTSCFEMSINRNEFVDKSTSPSLFEYFDQPIIILNHSQYVTIEKDSENGFVTQFFPGK